MRQFEKAKRHLDRVQPAACLAKHIELARKEGEKRKRGQCQVKAGHADQQAEVAAAGREDQQVADDGAVQERETMTSVSAMKNIPPIEPIFAFVSDRLDQDPGGAISKAPGKERPKATKSVKKMRLAIQLVARLFSAAGPKISVVSNPIPVKMMTMEAAYQTALRRPSAFVRLRFVKKLTVMGIIEYTQGVRRARRPPPKAARNIHSKERPAMPGAASGAWGAIDVGAGWTKALKAYSLER